MSCSLLCSRGEWESTRCTRPAVTHPSVRLSESDREQLLCTSWPNVVYYLLLYFIHLQLKHTYTHIWILHRWPPLTHCISIALLWFGTWSFLLINRLCTGWGAPHVWKKKRLEMNFKQILELISEAKTSPHCSLLAKTEAVWQWKHGQL